MCVSAYPFCDVCFFSFLDFETLHYWALPPPKLLFPRKKLLFFFFLEGENPEKKAPAWLPELSEVRMHTIAMSKIKDKCPEKRPKN